LGGGGRAGRALPDLAARGLPGPSVQPARGRAPGAGPVARRPARRPGGGWPVNGSHVPVLLEAVVTALAPAPGKLVVDGTFGAGGYTRALLEAGAQVTAFDRDPAVARFAEGLGERFRLI